MPVSAETLRLLMDAGVEGDELLRIVESIDRTPTRERSANAERQARFRANKKAKGVTDNVTSNVTEGVTPHVRVEDNLLPNKISRKQENKKAAALSDLDEFKADLATDCSPEQIDAFAKHRKAKNGQNSAYAAKLFRRDAASCGLSPSEAIDVAISRGWLTVKPEYLKGRPNSTAPPKPRNVGELSRDQLLTPRTEIDVTDYTSGRLAARDGGRLSPGSGDAGPFAINGDILGRI